MENKTKGIIIVTPWFGEFAGGAETLAKSMAVELNKRGIEVIVFTTCSKSPYDSWWKNYYEEKIYKVYNIETHRFSIGAEKNKIKYESALMKIGHNIKLSTEEQEYFFFCGINSDNLVRALESYVDNYEVLALPYFYGLTHSTVKTYPNKISIIPCFHNEEQFNWSPTEKLLSDAKNIFYNSIEEKEMTIKKYGNVIGKKCIEGIVTGVGVEPVNQINYTTNKILPFPYFVYVGRKEQGKNVHGLIEWFRKYKSSFSNDSRLVFLGGGDQKLIPKDDFFIDYGFVSETDKKNIIENSLGLINLSKNESFSIVIMEAWLNSVPVVVDGKCPVTKGHAIRSNGGLFPETSDEFILALDYLITHPEQAKLMGLNGKRYVENNFSFDTVLEKYLIQLNML